MPAPFRLSLSARLLKQVSMPARTEKPDASQANDCRPGLRASFREFRVRFRSMLRGPSAPDQRNQRYLVLDAMPVGFVEGIITFLPVFLVRLGASGLILGLLSSLPALVGMLLAVPAGQFLARQRSIVRLTSVARLVCYASYSLIGLVPFLLSYGQSEAITAIWVWAAVPQVVVIVGITAIMGAASAPDNRLALLGRRWSLVCLISTGTILVAGQALGLIAFPLNYQVLFLLCALGAAGTYLITSRIELTNDTSHTVHYASRDLLGQYRNTLRTNRAFVNFTSSHMVLRLGMAMAAPLLPIYWVRNVQASDAAVSYINSGIMAAAIVGYAVWSRASQRHGSRRVLLMTGLGVALYPFLTAMTHREALLVLWSVMVGFFVAGQDLALFDMLYATCPPDERPVYLGLFQATSYLAIFIGPLAGTLLADAIGIVPALMACSALRLAGLGLVARVVVPGRTS